MYKVPKPRRIACGQNDSRCIFSFSIPALYSSAHSLLGESSGELGFPLDDFVNRTGEGGYVGGAVRGAMFHALSLALYSQL